jgi:hypothetical protein
MDKALRNEEFEQKVTKSTKAAAAGTPHPHDY